MYIKPLIKVDPVVSNVCRNAVALLLAMSTGYNRTTRRLMGFMDIISESGSNPKQPTVPSIFMSG